MGKIWLKSPDPDHQCCGCEGKTGPCDSCCLSCIFNTTYANLAAAELALTNSLPWITDCLFYTLLAPPEGKGPLTYSMGTNVLEIETSPIDSAAVGVLTSYFFVPNPTTLTISCTPGTLAPGPEPANIIRVQSYCPNTHSFYAESDTLSCAITEPGYYYVSALMANEDSLPTLNVTVTNTDGSPIILSPFKFCYYTDFIANPTQRSQLSCS